MNPGGVMAHILVIEDDTCLRKIICKILEKEGHQVFEAPNGNVAFKWIEKQSLDLVITDIVMPEKEGIETIIQIRHEYPDLKVIAMSGCSESSLYLSNAKAFGAEVVIKKPIEKDVLINVIKATIDSIDPVKSSS